MGFDVNPVEFKKLTENTELLLIFGKFLTDNVSVSDLSNNLKQIPVKFLFSSHASELDALMDYVLPVSVIAEKAGSLTNVEGNIQQFKPVLEPLKESWPEWEILLNIGKGLDIDFKYYNQFRSPHDILTELGKEISFFEKIK